MINGLGYNFGIEPVTVRGCSQASTRSTRAPNANEGLAPKPQWNRASQSLRAWPSRHNEDCRQAATGELSGSCHKWRSRIVDVADPDPSDRSSFDRSGPRPPLKEEDEEVPKRNPKRNRIKKKKNALRK